MSSNAKKCWRWQRQRYKKELKNRIGKWSNNTWQLLIEKLKFRGERNSVR
jgi:hypothetical protein